MKAFDGRKGIMAVAGKTRGRPVDGYMNLIRHFPLRPIRTKAEHDQALSIVQKLGLKPEGSLTPGERDYFETLLTLLEAYDKAHAKLPMPLNPLVFLSELMEHRQMSVTDLGNAIFDGSRSAASDILRGKRPLSLKIIQRLAAHFRVSPGDFVIADAKPKKRRKGAA
jgi:HTH-type transcriptional regulator/antitoxin HigA